MLLLTAMMLTGGQPIRNPLRLIAVVLTWVLLNVFFFLMLKTGKTHEYRSFLFIVLSVAFVLGFITELLSVRGSMALTQENMINGETPFCHIVIPMTIIPAALTRTIIFPGSLLTGFASIASMLVLWFGATLALGRGWCSWGCFFGGLDEGFSCLAKKPVLKNIDDKWTYLPYAVLLVVVIMAAVTLTPFYCEWLCPFKTVTEFFEVNSFKSGLQAVIFVSLFAGLVVVLPVLTRRRIQCGLFCPFGAFQSFTNKINPFEVRIDSEQCPECNLCVKTCPTFSLDGSSIEKGQPRLSCTRCGHCIDVCPKQAISYHIKGTPLKASPRIARVLFLYPSFLLMSTVGGGMIVGAIWRILKLITTGRIL
jgi:polyferredoxin